jgi:iron(III) transport system substrate-binding protein
MRDGGIGRFRLVICLVAGVLVAGACSGDGDDTLRIYTSVTQGTVDSVVEGFAELNPDVDMQVFRAPTGELTARIAAEQREGGLQADILWLTDPLSMHQYEVSGVLQPWAPENGVVLPEEFVTETSWGTRVLTMVMIVRDGVDPPRDWNDLVDERFAGAVAFPDPGFAGSSLAVLGYFASTDGYGMDFYRDLAANGAVQVNAPGEVVTGVAEGRFDAGITLAFSARAAIGNGSPISIAWPISGAIAFHSPIGVAAGGDNVEAAQAFVEFALSEGGQQRIVDTGWQPASWLVPWRVEGGLQVSADWGAVSDQREALLSDYRAIFGG